MEADSDQTVYDIRTMQQIASDSMSSQRFPMMLLGAFAGLALVLASIGIYGVISYSVAQRVPRDRDSRRPRRREAQYFSAGHWTGSSAGSCRPRDGRGGRARCHPVAVELLASALWGWCDDPVTFVAVSVVLTGAAVLACYIPARQATRVDPMVALRHE